MCAVFATAHRVKITFGGFQLSVATAARREKTTVYVVVCDVRRPGQLERPEQRLGHTKQHGPQRGEPRSGACENLVCALKVLAIQHMGGDCLVDMIFEGLLEQSRLKITNELRRFIEVNTSEAARIGDLENNSEATNAARPKFTAVFSPVWRWQPRRGARRGFSGAVANQQTGGDSLWTRFAKVRRSRGG